MLSQTCIILSIRIFLKFNQFFFRQQILLVRRDDHVYECLEHPVFAISRHVQQAPAPTGRKTTQWSDPIRPAARQKYDSRCVSVRVWMI